MYRSHSTLGEREVPVRDFTAGPERPKVVRVITRLNIGGPTIHTQLEQESLDVLRVRFVPAARFTAEDLQMLETNLRARVGRSIHLEFECTDRIPRSANGKFRFVISRLDRNVPKSCGSSRG